MAASRYLVSALACLQVPTTSAASHPFVNISQFSFPGVNHMQLLQHDGVFDVLRNILGIACPWSGIWATSLGYFVVLPTSLEAVMMYVFYIFNLSVIHMM